MIEDALIAEADFVTGKSISQEKNLEENKKPKTAKMVLGATATVMMRTMICYDEFCFYQIYSHLACDCLKVLVTRYVLSGSVQNKQ